MSSQKHRHHKRNRTADTNLYELSRTDTPCQPVQEDEEFVTR